MTFNLPKFSTARILHYTVLCYCVLAFSTTIVFEQFYALVCFIIDIITITGIGNRESICITPDVTTGFVN